MQLNSLSFILHLTIHFIIILLIIDKHFLRSTNTHNHGHTHIQAMTRIQINIYYMNAYIIYTHILYERLYHI